MSNGATSPPSEAVGPAVGTLEVLVAESDGRIAALLADLVQQVRADAFVHQVSDGEAALAYCHSHLPDLVIADRELPLLDGLELLRQLRKRPRAVPLPYILISAQLDAASVRAALPLSPSAYLAKPLDVEKLRERLQLILPEVGAGAGHPPLSLEDYLEGSRQEGKGAPLLSDVRGAVTQCLQSKEQDLGELEASFSRDPQVTAMLISAAGAAAQGSPCQTLSQALQRLGIPRALNLVLGLTLQRSSAVRDPRLGELAAAALDQALRSAELARWLAQALRLDAELCYTAGLLHNIGELALLRALQSWLDDGGELEDQQITQAVLDRSAPFGSALRIQLRLSLSLRELVAAYYSLDRGVFSRESLVLNLTRLLLELAPEEPLNALSEQRCVRMLQIDVSVLQRIPPELYRPA